VHHGVALADAEAMPTFERIAAYVAHGQFEGGNWNWRSLKWDEPNK
jgi:hypothetical protein